MVTYEGEKMSKSIGNTISPVQMLQQARPLVVRYYLGSAHYRSVLDYRPTSLEEARVAIERVEAFLAATSELMAPNPQERRVPQEFADALDDDMNIPRALAVLHEQTRAGNAALAAGALRCTLFLRGSAGARTCLSHICILLVQRLSCPLSGRVSGESVMR